MNLCRICLCSRPRKDISELKVTEHDKKVIYIDIMMFCLGIQVKEDSNLCTKLCVKCFKKIIDFYNFKTLAQNNEAYLRSVAASHDTDDLVTAVIDEEEVFLPENIKQEELNFSVKEKELLLESDVSQQSDDVVHDIKEECKEEESGSDDEYLSDIRKVNYESESDYKTEEKRPVKKPKKRRNRRKKYEAYQKCKTCGIIKRDIYTHAIMHMSPIPTFKCDHCGKEFGSKHGILKHMRTHFGINNTCSICNKEVLYLKNHMTLMHFSERNRYQCESCDRRCSSQYRLNIHMKTHMAKTHYECEVCNLKCPRQSILATHKRRVHDKERLHVCEYCSKSYFNNFELKNHLRTHTKEKPFKCETCNKGFTSSVFRNKHKVMHNVRERKYKCTICNKTFLSNGNLRVHMSNHINGKTHPCQYCGLKFYRQHQVKRHEFTAHLKHVTDEDK